MPATRAKKSTPSRIAKNTDENSVEIHIPSIPRIKSFTPILIVLLIIASFLLGMMFQKLQDLEKGGTVLSAQTGGNAQPTPQTPTGPVVTNVSVGHLPARGNTKAKVKIIEFADLRCPFCEQFFTNVLPQIQKDYIDTGKVTMYFRHFAFLGPASIVAANAAECANEQGKFWEFYNYMYANQPDESDTTMYTTDNLTTVAGQLGMDTSQFNTCLSSNKYSSNVTKDYTDGQAAGVSGTPTFYVNGTQLVGAQPYSEFQKAINAALAKAK
jgi:protein-disulfide isomerase